MSAGGPAGEPILEMGELTARDVDALDRERTVVFITISPIEEHGPHLPLATDIIEAGGVARALARRLAGERPGWRFLFYPALPVGADCFIYPGSIEVRPRVVAALVHDIGLSFARSGFKKMLISSHHGGLRHNVALEAAARRIARKTGARVASLAGWLALDLYFRGGVAEYCRRAGDSDEAGKCLAVDCHAGAFETSEMLVLEPGLVRGGWETLPPVLVPLLRLRLSSARDEAAGLGYFGAPALASAARGRGYLDFIVERVLPDVRRILDGEPVERRLPWKMRAAIGLARLHLAYQAWRG